MLHRSVAGLTISYDPAEQETADLIAAACEHSLAVIREAWGFDPPAECRLYVMTDWRSFFFQSAPWSWRILLALSYPLWRPRVQRSWPYAAAWTQRYGRRVAIGIKPSRLLEKSERRIGSMVYIEEPDLTVRVRQLTCHELAHAAMAHLKLPAWLNEGLAHATVDRFLGKRVIRAETVAMIRDFEPKGPPLSYRELSRAKLETIAYTTIRGYWIVRYLQHTSPEVLPRLLAACERDPAHAAHPERQIAADLGMDPERFWEEIDGVIAACCAAHGGAGHHAMAD